MCDIFVQNEGSLFILYPQSKIGREWLDEHIAEDAMTWGDGGIVVEHRYVGAIIDGAQVDGLVLE